MLPNWENRLAEYVAKASGDAFTLGKHDCLTFVEGATVAMRGFGFAGDWLNRYMLVSGEPMVARQLAERFGFDTMVQAMDSKLKRETLRPPPRGSIVGIEKFAERSMTRLALGMSVGESLVFLRPEGVVKVSPRHAEYAWKVT